MQLPPESSLAVVDWNFVQTNSYRADVPTNYECLISDTVGLEIVGKKTSVDFKDACDRFANWVRKNVSRIWIARPIGQLIARQANWLCKGSSVPVCPIRRDDVVDCRRTRRFRDGVREPGFDWSAYLSKADSRPFMQYELGRAALTQMVREIALDAKLVSLLSTRDEGIADAVRSSDFSDLLASLYPARMRDQLRMAIAAHPSKFIQVRCARVKLYYSLLRARSPTFGDPNDWDDLQYAVLASYTGHLVTFDTGLRECVQYLFPRIRLVHVPE